jgi:hypothetical protein
MALWAMGRPGEGAVLPKNEVMGGAIGVDAELSQ